MNFSKMQPKSYRGLLYESCRGNSANRIWCFDRKSLERIEKTILRCGERRITCATGWLSYPRTWNALCISFCLDERKEEKHFCIRYVFSASSEDQFLILMMRINKDSLAFPSVTPWIP